MPALIFQSKEEETDLVEEIKVGKRSTWYATRYRQLMSPGTKVYFWMAGEPSKRGIYGIGQIASEPYLKRSWDAYGVDVLYTKKIEPPLLASDIRANTVLSSLLIFRAPAATNFSIDDGEARELDRLIEMHVS